MMNPIAIVRTVWRLPAAAIGRVQSRREKKRIAKAVCRDVSELEEAWRAVRLALEPLVPNRPAGFDFRGLAAKVNAQLGMTAKIPGNPDVAAKIGFVREAEQLRLARRARGRIHFWLERLGDPLCQADALTALRTAHQASNVEPFLKVDARLSTLLPGGEKNQATVADLVADLDFRIVPRLPRDSGRESLLLALAASRAFKKPTKGEAFNQLKDELQSASDELERNLTKILKEHKAKLEADREAKLEADRQAKLEPEAEQEQVAAVSSPVPTTIPWYVTFDFLIRLSILIALGGVGLLYMLISGPGIESFPLSASYWTEWLGHANACVWIGVAIGLLPMVLFWRHGGNVREAAMASTEPIDRYARKHGLTLGEPSASQDAR